MTLMAITVIMNNENNSKNHRNNGNGNGIKNANNSKMKWNWWLVADNIEWIVILVVTTLQQTFTEK